MIRSWWRSEGWLKKTWKVQMPSTCLHVDANFQIFSLPYEVTYLMLFFLMSHNIICEWSVEKFYSSSLLLNPCRSNNTSCKEISWSLVGSWNLRRRRQCSPIAPKCSNICIMRPLKPRIAVPCPPFSWHLPGWTQFCQRLSGKLHALLYRLLYSTTPLHYGPA